jgi:hypothetical protein
MALFTFKEILQLALAGMLAPDSVMLLVVLVSDNAAPSHVLEGAGVPSVRLAGNEKVMPDWVSANALELVKLKVSNAGTFTATLAGENVALTVGAAGVTVRSAIQAEALVPAEDGAVLAAPLAVKLTTAVSVLPAESFTTSVKVPAPLDMTFTVDAVAAPTICTTPVLDQAYEPIVAPQAAALPPASSVTLPAVKPAGIFTAAMGFKAAWTECSAFTIPAPQVVVVQAHSTLELVVDEHCASPTGCGNGVALALMRAISCGGVRFALAARIRATMPETMGAEKLVPKFELL